MKCVFCGGAESKVVDSRYLKDTSIRRRRECIKCGKRFTTYETVETNPMIVTNVFNEREPFKLEKLIESLKYSTYCQNVSDIQEGVFILLQISRRLCGNCHFLIPCRFYLLFPVQ
ncbi:MAG: hypothetical protein J6Q15_01345 [Clostridia bacterium]|nr:hypothetical protein [Clostridia bacterium]